MTPSERKKQPEEAQYKQKCKKHGVVHKKGGYASCPSNKENKDKLVFKK